MEKQDEPTTNHSKQNTNRIMGIAAVFISLLSMVAVLYQSYLAKAESERMRVQQSATVLPYLADWYNNVGNAYKCVLENKGVGPAFIKEVELLGVNVQTKDTVTFNNSGQLAQFVHQQSPFFDSVGFINSPIYPNMLLSPNEKRTYFDFSFDDEYQKKRFQEEFYKYHVGLKITYEDVYGTAWVLDSKKGYPVKVE
ncbi:MAG: hypothetical protein AAF960_10110 [Bacteroidota bacterium]